LLYLGEFRTVNSLICWTLPTLTSVHPTSLQTAVVVMQQILFQFEGLVSVVGFSFAN